MTPVISGLAALTAYTAKPFGFTFNIIPAFDDTTAWRAAMAAGLFPGAALSAALSGGFRNVPVTPLWQETFPSGIRSRIPAVFTGGFLIIFGALLGGGCTTGAFMAGFPTLSVGSFAMGITFFAVGMGTAFLLYWGKWRKVSEVQEQMLDLETD